MEGERKKNAYIDTVEHVEPRLGARAASAVAAVADVDAEGVVAAVVRAQRGGEARAAAHAERVAAPAVGAGGVALRRRGRRPRGPGRGGARRSSGGRRRRRRERRSGPPCSWRRSPPRGAA